MDERFILHRFYATRLATIVGAVLMGVWFNYEYFAHHIIRYDFLIILFVMALTKVAAMVYYRWTN